MARVTRAAAASSSRKDRLNSSGAWDNTSNHGSDQWSDRGSAFVSLHSLHSQDEEEEFSCATCCAKACTLLYNLTIASCCQYFMCLRSRHRSHGSNLSTPVEDVEVREMKERLKFHFMNPFQKWCYAERRRFPWKLIVQILNIILVTTQVCIFATNKFSLTHFVQQNQKTFTQLFILNPDQPDADNPIPSPITTIYSFDQLFAQINYTACQYYSLKEVAVGPYSYQWDESGNSADLSSTPMVVMEIQRYNSGNIDPEEKFFHIDGKIVTENHIINNTCHHPLSGFINETRIKNMLNSILNIRLNFTVTSVYLDPRNPTCFQFNIIIEIQNDVHSGNMPVEMTVKSEINQCSRNSWFHSRGAIFSVAGITSVDIIVMIFAVFSMIQCIRSLVKSLHFAKIVKAFFIKKYNYKLKFHQVLPLFNLWFLMVAVSNLLVLVGSLIKILLNLNAINSIIVMDIASIILGLAVMSQWCGILRFLSYFDKYNMLLLTLRLAMPSVLRFIVCAGILYFAFLLCGWLVLGPYHPKFRDPSVTSECLFSLINGDDMYMTYQEMSTVSGPAWVFSKIYLYVFIALFIYVVLSVFISLISDTYETLHEQWTVRSKGLLQDFANDQLDKPTQRPRTYSEVSQLEEDEDYQLIREAETSASYGAMDSRPMMATGRPAMDAKPTVVSIQLHSPPSPHMNRAPSPEEMKF